MRFLGLIITIAIIGYAIHIYLSSSQTVETKPEQYIDQASETTDAMNRALQNHQDKLDSAN